MKRRTRPRSFAAVLAAMCLYVVSLMPTAVTAHESELIDPPDHPSIMPPELQRIQPRGSLRAYENHVRKLSEAQLAQLAADGVEVVANEDGLLKFDVKDGGRAVHLAVFDTQTRNGTFVIGLATATAESSAVVVDRGLLGLGPQEARANVRAQDHTHVLGPPFHDNCSYLFQYGGGETAYVHICSLDVGNIKQAGALAAAAIGTATGLPLLGWLGGLVWWVGISLFQDSSGSINIDIPGTSAVYHYGSINYLTGSRKGWYYFYRSGSQYYGYALRQATGVLYYVRI